MLIIDRKPQRGLMFIVNQFDYSLRPQKGRIILRFSIVNMHRYLFIIIFNFCFICFGYSQLKAHADTSKVLSTGSSSTFTVPEISAEYPGGGNNISKYLLDVISKKVSINSEEAELFRSPYIQFVVDEKGSVTNPKIIKSSNVKRIDDILIEAVNSLQKFKPAENNGKKVKQVFNIPLRICFK